MLSVGKIINTLSERDSSVGVILDTCIQRIRAHLFMCIFGKTMGMNLMRTILKFWIIQIMMIYVSLKGLFIFNLKSLF